MFEPTKEMEAAWLTAHSPGVDPGSFMIADERFHRLILPTILASVWPCLNFIEPKGVKSPDGEVGTAELIMILMFYLGGADKKIVVEENSRYVEDEYVPDEVFAGLFSSDDSESHMS